MKKQLLILISLFIITQSKAQKPVANFAASNDTICANDCISFTDLSTNNPTSWQWTFYGSPFDTSSVQNPQCVFYIDSGRYSVKLVVSNSSGSDSLTIDNLIIVNPTPPVPNITENSGVGCRLNSHYDTLFCSFDSSYVSYQWYHDSTLIQGATNSYLVIDLDSMTYSAYDVSIANKYGCSIAVGIEFFLYWGPPFVNFTANKTNICVGDSVEFYNESYEELTYRWTFPGGTPNTSTAACPPAIHYNSPGNYDVILYGLSNSGSDVDTLRGYITVNPQPCPTGINELNDIKSIILSPNPVTNLLTIQTLSFHANEAVTVSIMNVLGQETSPPAPLQMERGGATIDVSALPAGMYFLQLKTENGNAVKKFVKQ